MTLIVLTVVVVALLIAALAISLYAIGVFLNRTAGNLEDCVQNVTKLPPRPKAIGPGVVRINGAVGAFVDALPVLYEAAERIGAAKSAPYIDPSSVVSLVPSRACPFYGSAAPESGSGYLDGNSGNLGCLDA